MKTLIDIILIGVWMAAFLGVVSAAGHYRKNRRYAWSSVGRDEYRADRDAAIHVIVFFIGLLSIAVFYALTRMGG